MTEPTRIAVNAWSVRLPVMVEHTYSATVDPSTVTLETFDVNLERTRITYLVDREVFDTMPELVADVVKTMAKGLATYLGYIPMNPRLHVNHTSFQTSRRPRWWQVLRRLGLRPRQLMTVRAVQLDLETIGKYVPEANTIFELHR